MKVGVTRFGIVLVSFLTAFVMWSGQLAWAGSDKDTGNGNTQGTLSFDSQQIPNVGQHVGLIFSPPLSRDQQLTLHFKDQTTHHFQAQPKANYSDGAGEYTFTMPQLTPGDEYDVTVTANPKDGNGNSKGITYELSFTCPMDPGHQLPETRYAILFPIVLAGMLVWRMRRSGQKNSATETK